jgi:hypothetical protein
MPSESARVLACQRYVRFLFKSYLKWQSPRDVCDVSSLVRFHQPTIVAGESFYPADFYDVLRTQIMLQLETEYGCTASGWFPEVECKVVPEEGALSLNIWFTRAPKKPPAQRP